MKSKLEQYLTPAQAAARLAIHISTFWELVRDGKIQPVHKLGHRSTRIPESALIRFMESCRVDAGWNK